jgi:aspartate aminotransferase
MKYTEVKTLEPDFRLDLDAVKASITPNTAALIINSPNNPSGAIYPPEDLKRLSEILTEKSREFSRTIYLISDEPYREVLLDDVEVPFMANFYDNTIVCYSYSKSLSIAGERMGYILVPNANEDHDRLLTAIAGASKALGVSNAPSLFQYALIKCAGIHSDVELYRKNGAVLYKALTEMGYECTWPKGTFYMMVKTLEEDWAFCRRAAEMGLILVPCSGFGFPGYVRVALCVSEDTAVRSIPAFKKLLESYK